MYRKFFKRPFDFFVSLMALIILSPVLLIIAILVRFKLGSPILFKQDRPGKDEQIFKMYKFRTMTNQIDANGVLLADEERITKFGNFLRSTSLDELPELINIISGKMSLVGPRPLLVEYLAIYSIEQKKRHCIRPGLTGLAQISGRNAISWNEKFKLDINYYRNITFLIDVKIILSTITKVVRKTDVSSTTSVTMEKFTGNKKI